jgi:hypothetical protein
MARRVESEATQYVIHSLIFASSLGLNFSKVPTEVIKVMGDTYS